MIYLSGIKTRLLIWPKGSKTKVSTTLTERVVLRLQAYGIPATAITHSTKDGVLYHAVLSQGDLKKGIIMLYHGMNSSSLDMVERAVLFSQQGYGVLLVSFPKRKDRLYPYYTFGQNEADIVDSSYRLVKHYFPGRRICMHGVSMGAVAILMSTQKKLVDALVLESPYFSLEKVIHNGLLHHFGWLGKYLEAGFFNYLKLLHGVRNIKPAAQIGALKTPLFLIGGGSDPYMCPADMTKLYKNTQGDKQLWIVPKAAHDDYLQAQPSVYTRRIQCFLTPLLGVKKNDH